MSHSGLVNGNFFNQDSMLTRDSQVWCTFSVSNYVFQRTWNSFQLSSLHPEDSVGFESAIAV